MSEDQRVRPAGHVCSAITDGEAVLLDLRRDEFIGLNQVATSIWEDLSNGLTMEETARCIEQEYLVERQQARTDVADFVRRLVEKGLLEYQN